MSRLHSLPWAVAAAAALSTIAGASHAQTAAAATAPTAPTTSDGAPVREYMIDEGVPPSSARWKVIAGGLGATAVFYGLAQPFSYVWPDSPGMMDLRYPVVGPWMALANNTCAPGNPDCSTIWLVARGVLEVLDGIGQAGGVAVALEGIFLKTTPDTPSRPGAPSQPKKKPAPPPSENPLTPGTPGNLFYIPKPMVVGQQGVGLGILGVF